MFQKLKNYLFGDWTVIKIYPLVTSVTYNIDYSKSSGRLYGPTYTLPREQWSFKDEIWGKVKLEWSTYKQQYRLVLTDITQKLNEPTLHPEYLRLEAWVVGQNLKKKK